MRQLNGLFDSFDNLDSIEADSLTAWLKNPSSSIQLENYLGSKILYPTTLPLTDIDMKIDLAILREALRINGPNLAQRPGPLLGDNPFLNVTLRKVIIPKRFLYYTPDLVSLTWAFADGLLLGRKKQDHFEDLWTVVVADDIDEIVGSIIIPQFEGLGDVMNLSVSSKDYEVKAGSLIVVECPKNRC